MSKQKLLALPLFILLTLLFPKISSAHPGNTASDGCHYCRTRCDYWGVPWNARHCHGGYTPPAVNYSTPTSTPVPTAKPTNTPTPKPTATPKLTFSPTPAVKGETSEVTGFPKSSLSPTPTVETKVAGDTKTGALFPLGVLSFIGWIFYKYRNVLREMFKRN